MREAGNDAFDCALDLIIGGFVEGGEEIQNVDLTPLVAFRERVKELVGPVGRECDWSAGVGSAVCDDLMKGGSSVTSDDMIGVGDELDEHGDETVIFDNLGFLMVKFQDTEGGSLADVWVTVDVQRGLERIDEVFENAVDTETKHGADSEGADDGGGVLMAIQQEGVDSEEGLVLLEARVTKDVEINKFLDFEVGGLTKLDDIRKELGNIASEGHVGDDALESTGLFCFGGAIEICLKFSGFAFSSASEEGRASSSNAEFTETSTSDFFNLFLKLFNLFHCSKKT